MIKEMSAYAFCKEDISKIENYEEAVNDKSQCWDCNHLKDLYQEELITSEIVRNKEELWLEFIQEII